MCATVLLTKDASGNEIGPFRAIEESVVAHLTASRQRSDVYAWYSLFGTAGTAFGMMTCGWVIHHLCFDLGWDLVKAYRIIFWGYAVLGLCRLVLAAVLSPAVEAEKKKPVEASTSESTPLLGGETGPKPVKERRGLRALLPEISDESARVMISLCVLFALDSFASGLAPLSWVTFFFRSHYNLEEGKLGSVFFVTSIIAAASTIVASSLAKRFGNVNVSTSSTASLWPEPLSADDISLYDRRWFLRTSHQPSSWL